MTPFILAAIALTPAPAAQERSAHALLREARCTACHVDETGTRRSPPGPVLDGAGARRPAAYLRAFLSDPAGVRPGGAMPDVLPRPGTPERAAAVEALVRFLVSDGPVPAPRPRVADAATIERGRGLFHGIGCAACHEPFEDAASLEVPIWDFEQLGLAEASAPDRAEASAAAPLGDALRDWTGGGLAAFLVDPLAFHPDGRMPALALTPAEASALATYLAFESAVRSGASSAEWTRAPGVAFEYFEAEYGDAGPVLEALEPVRTGAIASLAELPEHAEDYFAFRFRTMVEVPRSGGWRFALTSDDGSMLWIDGDLAIDNGGAHGATERRVELFLAAGRHALELTYFELTGDMALELAWEGPGTARGPIPAAALERWSLDLGPERAEPSSSDPALAAEGRELFERYSCASCHARADTASAPSELAFPDLCGPAGAECSGARYSLGPGRSAALAAHLAAGAPVPEAATRLADALELLRCTACHERDGRGGPAGDRRGLFRSAGTVDLGDHGRFPPDLTGVGAKLTPAWLEEVLAAEGRVRPYVRTRMPSYGAANVGEVAELLLEVDAPASEELPETLMSSAEVGRELAGPAGLGCVQCHHFAGHEAPGGPALDLADARERLRPAWFRAMLLDPAAVGMEARMPTLWKDGRSPVTDVLDGDPRQQTDALWSWLARAPSLDLPDGLLLTDTDYEVVVGDEPRTVGVFMAGASARTLLVGYPEGLHVAFDVAASRLVSAWRGRFFNAVGTWHGRAGVLEHPGWGDDLELPNGPPLARLAAPDSAWPIETGRAAGYRVLGRRFDARRRPVFRYALGPIEVEELDRPRVHEEGQRLVRELLVSSPEAVGDLWLRAAMGTSIALVDGDDAGGPVWEVDGRVRVRLEDASGAAVVPGPSGDELRVPVVLRPGKAQRVVLELAW